MKTQIITIFTALLLVTGIAETTKAAVAKNETVTVLTDISDINKIEVRGNVELYISDGPSDQVKVYNKYYAESAVVKSRNGVLSIASYTAEKLVVWVTAYDLRSVSAYDDAEVRSFGDLSKIEFDVDLHNNATAKLSLDAFNANLTVNDHAKATLSGSTEQYNVKYNDPANVSYADFKAVHVSKVQTGTAAVVKKGDDLADL